MNKELLKYIEDEGYTKLRPTRGKVRGKGDNINKSTCDFCNVEVKTSYMKRHQKGDRCILQQKLKAIRMKE